MAAILKSKMATIKTFKPIFVSDSLSSNVCKKVDFRHSSRNSYIDTHRLCVRVKFEPSWIRYHAILTPPTYESDTLTVTLSGPTTTPGGQTGL